MLAQAERGEKIEGHRRDEIVILRRSDVCTVMRVARFQARPQIFPIVRSRHITSPVSERRGRILSARLVVCRETQVHPATGRIGKYASVAVTPAVCSCAPAGWNLPVYGLSISVYRRLPSAREPRKLAYIRHILHNKLSLPSFALWATLRYSLRALEMPAAAVCLCSPAPAAEQAPWNERRSI